MAKLWNSAWLSLPHPEPSCLGVQMVANYMLELEAPMKMSIVPEFQNCNKHREKSTCRDDVGLPEPTQM